MFDFEEALKNLPDNPGVYIMKNSNGEIIYIGKAVSLKNRVRQYFQNSKNHSPKVIAMVSHIAEFEYILTDSEIEALILECNLIKKHRPRYNILLKDDKHYPYLKVTLNEDYPRVIIVRRMKKDGAKYFGPYTDVFALRETVHLIRKLYPIRSCKKNIVFGRQVDRPCLNYHIKRCIAPCRGNVDKNKYMEMIKDIMLFLSGKHDELVENLTKKMQEASDLLDYEKAAQIRDQIISIKKVQEKQKIVSSSFEDEDVIAFASDDENTCMEVFSIRGGKLLGKQDYYFNSSTEFDEEIISQFIMQLYSEKEDLPRDILLQNKISEIESIESYLTGKKGSKVNIKVPVKGSKKQIVNMAYENAKAALEQKKFRVQREKEMTGGAVSELSFILDLDNVPKRIEAFDISNIQGTDPVGSMVVFENGKPTKSEYRRFKIKTVNQPDDYKSMEEILTRRFKRGISELKDEDLMKNGKFSKFPDVIMMDGGVGQVNVAVNVLKEYGLNIPVCGMVKDDNHRTRGLIYEGSEISIKKDSASFKLITRIQDEAHRFAISYHRSLREKKSIYSIIDEIPMIGEKRRIEIMRHFESLDAVKAASIDELKKIKGMNEKAAEEVYNYFRK